MKKRHRGGAEHIRKQARILGEVGIHEADDLCLGLGDLVPERLAVAGELPQGLHLVGGELRGVVFANAEGLGDEEGIDPVVLDSGETLQVPDGMHMHGIDDADRPAPGHQVREARHPVVPRGLHGDDRILWLLGHALKPGDALLEAGGVVLE